MSYEEAAAIVMQLASGSYRMTTYAPNGHLGHEVEVIDEDLLSRAMQALAVVSADLLTERMR